MSRFHHLMRGTYRRTHQFEAKAYNDAVVTLGKLPQSDAKVLHNQAVAMYYVQHDANSFVSKVLEAKEKLTTQDSDGNDDYDDDETDSAVMCYNLAVIHYQRREFNKALELLDRLFKVIEAIEEVVARKICLLLLDLYMIQYQPDKAGYILQYLERTLAGPQTKDKGDDKKSKENEKDGGKEESAVNPDLELLKFQLHQYRARMYIITRSMKACKREIKSALNFSNQSATALFLKSNFEYARRNYRKAIKLLNSCPKTESHLSGQSLAGLYYNDLGCVHFQMQKYALANVYFNKALQANEKEAGRIPFGPDGGHEPLKTLVADRIHELMYNHGLNFLFMRRPELAFKCFKSSMLLLRCNPRLWLRLAECCVLLHITQEQKGVGENEGDLIVRKAGTAQNRKIIVSPPSNVSSPNSPAGLSLADGISYLTTANTLLRTAMTKKEPRPEASSSPTVPPPGTAPAAPVVSFALPGTRASPIQESDVPAILCHIKANLAYCHLGNSNYSEALTEANSLLALPNCPGPIRFLAHLYAAESLVRMRRITQAIQHLAPENVGDLSTGMSQDQADGGDAGETEPSTRVPNQAFTADSAKVLLLVNIAAAYAIKGTYDSCLTCLKQASQLNPAPAIRRKIALMTIYALLSEDRPEDALNVLEKNKLPF